MRVNARARQLGACLKKKKLFVHYLQETFAFYQLRIYTDRGNEPKMCRPGDGQAVKIFKLLR